MLCRVLPMPLPPCVFCAVLCCPVLSFPVFFELARLDLASRCAFCFYFVGRAQPQNGGGKRGTLHTACFYFQRLLLWEFNHHGTKNSAISESMNLYRGVRQKRDKATPGAESRG
mmetsp:Transcript_23217/g.49443  ORF Transcript_23217/g.49443 Transcript_23217/m.49443 type:complete len:114 (+) Transcript_23217:849-1190(+)